MVYFNVWDGYSYSYLMLGIIVVAVVFFSFYKLILNFIVDINYHLKKHYQRVATIIQKRQEIKSQIKLLKQLKGKKLLVEFLGFLENNYYLHNYNIDKLLLTVGINKTYLYNMLYENKYSSEIENKIYHFLDIFNKTLDEIKAD